MSADAITFCANLENKEKIGQPELIVCPFSVFDAWASSVLSETDGVIASSGCVINQIQNLF